MFYILIIFLLLFLTYKYDYRGELNYKKSWFIIILILFILTAGLRYRLGVDSIRYESKYLDFPDLFHLTDFDFSSTRYGIAYIGLTSLARTISDSFVALQLIQATFVNCVIFWFINKYSKHIFFSVLVYFIALYSNFMCEVMREACAVSCLLLAYPHFVKSEWLKYYIFSTLCVLFHPSGIIALLLPLCLIKGINTLFIIGKRTIWLMIGLYILGSAISIVFFDYLRLIAIASVEELADSYATSELAGQVFNVNGIISNVFLYILYPLVSIKYLKDSSLNANQNTINRVDHLQLMVACGLYFAVLAIPIGILYRFNNYFFMFSIIAISNWIFEKIPYRNKKVKLSFNLWLFIVTPFFFFQIYGLIKTKPNGSSDIRRYYPYSSVLNPQKDAIREKMFRNYNAF